MIFLNAASPTQLTKSQVGDAYISMYVTVLNGLPVEITSTPCGFPQGLSSY